MALLSAVSSSDPEEKRYLQPVLKGFLLGAEEHMEPGFYLFDPGRTSVGKAMSGLLMGEIAGFSLDTSHCFEISNKYLSNPRNVHHHP